MTSSDGEPIAMKSQIDEYTNLCVALPVINEVGNLEYLLPSLLTNYPGVTVLVIDDSSTDGTKGFILQLKAGGSKIQYIRNESRFGIGYAHKLALEYAITNGFSYLCTMDADLTHSPKYIRDLLVAAQDNSVVIASRFANGGEMVNWKFSRRLLAHMGHKVTKLLFELNLDMSSSYRIYRLPNERLQKVFRSVPDNYDFFFSSTILLNSNEVSLSEQGVRMFQRLDGSSKMTFKYVASGIFRILSWRIFLKQKRQNSSALLED